jgi:hypothetical protein
MRKIIRNSAKCTHCGVEIISTHRHDYKSHYCKDGPIIGKKREWMDNPEAIGGQELVETGEDAHPYFSVDGGLEYIRRGFTRKQDYVETSIEEEGAACPQCGCSGYHKMGCTEKSKNEST